ncbi:MAG: hypothetical protein K0V04_19000 [Deltaproteobacteria bacterium]|nr:hypothetical protein [Deltaproteobacteria bacterium]
MNDEMLCVTTKALALLLMGAGSVTGCVAEDEVFDERELELVEGEFDESLDEVSGAVEPQVLDAIAAAPTLADDEVEALFAESTPTLRDVIRLVDVESLPPGLTLADLDSPVTLELTEPPVDAPLFDPVDDLAADLDPQLIGEQACGTTSISNANNGASISMGPDPGCGFAFDGAVSPNTFYNPTGCPNQFITQVNGTWGRALSFYSSWPGTLNSTYCPLARQALSAYGAFWTVQNVNGMWFLALQWSKIGTTIQHGTWVDGGWFPGCYWQYDNNYGPLPSLPSNHGYNRIRTAAQGLVLAIFPFKQQIESGVRHGSGPC